MMMERRRPSLPLAVPRRRRRSSSSSLACFVLCCVLLLASHGVQGFRLPFTASRSNQR